MDEKEKEFLNKLLSTFRVESDEHVNAIASGLIKLEQASSNEQRMGLIETIFREAHSLKGAARAVNANNVETMCQTLEGVFASLKDGRTALSSDLLDRLHQSVDTLTRMLSSPQSAQVSARLEEQPTERAKAITEDMPDKSSFSTETVRIAAAKLDSLLLQTEELLSAKHAAPQHATELRDMKGILDKCKREFGKLRLHFRMVPGALELLERSNASMMALETKLSRLATATDQEDRSLAAMVDHLLVDMKTAVMLPFSSLLELLPRLVRDLSRNQGKQVELRIEGQEIEVDRRILEQMKDPLIHLIRNSIDHGIEEPAERRKKSKQPQGNVTVAVSQRESGRVEILVSDDGAGIDVARVRAAAAARGVISREDAGKLPDIQALSLIFHSGVSTSPMITDLSGRGLGLAIVQEKVEKLQGSVTLSTEINRGTAFRVVLPATLATFRGVLVRVNDSRFVFPTSAIDRMVRLRRTEIKTVENRATIIIDEQPVSAVQLGHVLELPRSQVKEDSGFVHAVVLASMGRRIAFLVDEVLQEQEVLVKGLGKQLSRVRNIAGATVLVSGGIAPILNVTDLMKSAAKNADIPAPPTVLPGFSPREEPKQERILVVEDSITARSLLKNILEAAGFNVKTAVDGIDAFTTLRNEDFDLVVSDVDMPRMNGLDLTARIRADKKLSDLPVVLVTALESREDRERGIEVGANAYIVKQSFDQGNLLEAVRRLI